MNKDHELAEIIQPYIAEDRVLGAALAVVHKNKITYTAGFGYTSTEEGCTNISPRTLFAYGSISKVVCATLIMRLVEKGLLDLDLPIKSYLPDLLFSNQAYGRQITLRHLLSHTSGLPMAGKYWGPRDPDSLRRFVLEQIPYYSFVARPGKIPLYSNAVICIAGYIAEVVTGHYYDDLAQMYVFDPLHMEHSTFDHAVAMTYPLALPHTADANGQIRTIHRMTSNVSGNPSTNALGTVLDLANLAQMYLNQGSYGDRPFLTPTAVAEMQRLHGKRHIEGATHPFAHTYAGTGLGFMIGQYKGKRIVRHGGTNLSYQCFFDLFPDDGVGLVLLTNYSQVEPLTQLVLTLYDHLLHLPKQGVVHLESPKPLSPTPGQFPWSAYAGVYINVQFGKLVEIIQEKGMVLRWQGSDETTLLVPFAEGKFYGEVSPHLRIPVTFLSDTDDPCSHVMIGGTPYQRQKIDPNFVPHPAHWQAYVGTYKDPSNTNHCEVFHIQLAANTLCVIYNDEETIATPLSDSRFLTRFGLIEFIHGKLADQYILVQGQATPYFPVKQTLGDS